MVNYLSVDWVKPNISMTQVTGIIPYQLHFVTVCDEK